MNFEDEPYVRVYKRKTVTTKLVGWEGRTTLYHLMLEVDRAGVFDLDGEDPAAAVSALTELPLQIVRVGLARLMERNVVQLVRGVLLLPRFIEAQEARQSDAQRQRESRERRRALIRLSELGVTTRDASERNRDQASQFVTADLLDLADSPADQESRQRDVQRQRESGRFASGVDPVTLRDDDVTLRDHQSQIQSRPSHVVTPCHSSSADPADLADHTPPTPQGGDPTDSGARSDEDSDDPDDGLTPRQKAEEAEVVAKIFAFWKQEHGHPRAKLDRKRRNRIKARLREGFTPRELCIAIRAAKKDRFLMGENETGTVYDGIQTLLRDAAKVEDLLELEGTKRGINGSRVVSPPKPETWTERRARLLRDHTAEELEAMGHVDLAIEKRGPAPRPPGLRPRIALPPALAPSPPPEPENAPAPDSVAAEGNAGG